MKENKEQWPFSFITGRGTYQQDKFEEDADKLVEYYRDRGYITARIGQPEVKTLEDAPDGKQRFVELRVPVTEGRRYRVGNFTFDGNTVVKAEALRPLFKLKEGEYYAEKNIRKGLEKAREVYGSGGYFEFTGFPDLSPRDQPKDGETETAPAPAVDPERPGHRRRDDADAGRQAVLRQPHHLRRQHDDARQRDSPRDAAVRERRLQHRGAQVQRQAAEPARLLQDARGRRHRRRQDARRRQQGRRHAQARGAEPEPADVRRRRLAVRGLLRAAVVPDGELPRHAARR